MMELPNGLTGVATDAVRADGKLFTNTEHLVFEQPLTGLSQTLASGVKSAPINLRDATNQQVIRDNNRMRGGTTDAIALGIVFRIRHTVTVAAAAGVGASVRASHNIYNRYALSTIDVKPGKAGEAYLMSRGDTSIGQLMCWLESSRAFTQCFKTIRTACDGYQITADRGGLSGSGIAQGARDNQPLVAARNMMLNTQRRTVAAGTLTTVPEAGTEYEDLIVFPLTADGPTGATSSGFSVESVFSAENLWSFFIRPVFDTGIYSAGSTSTDFTIDVSLVYRVHCGAAMQGQDPIPPVYGKVWVWNNNIGTIPDGVKQTLSGAAVEAHALVGYAPTVYGEAIGNSPVPVVDGANYFFQELEPGSGVAVKVRIIPPNLAPANLNTDARYVQIGRENAPFPTLPFGGYTQAKGNEGLKEYNGLYRVAAINDPFNVPREGSELPLFTDVGARSATTSFVVYTDNSVNPSVKYGTSFGAGTNVSTTSALRPGDSDADLGIGGLNILPLAWCDRSVHGFTGLEVRAAGDRAGIVVQSIGGYLLPKTIYSGSTPANVHTIRVLTNYDQFSTDPCACDHNMVTPAVFSPNKATMAKGAALTSGIVITALPTDKK